MANILLARLLSPEDFGLIAIIAIFIQISQTCIDSGFSNALIQKKGRTQTDYSTVFIFNLAVSIVFYVILFLCSPVISVFFKDPKLVSLTRVVGINLIIGALMAVHKTRLSIQLRFKIQAIISLISAIVSAVISIWMAYNQFGVWSLVFLSLINNLLQVILIYIFVKWMPSLVFSLQSFRTLFSYSSKLLGASLIHLLYRNIYPVIIGKKFSSEELGYFNRADTFAMYVPALVGAVVSKVAFPIFSRIQDDNCRLRHAYSKYIIFSSLIVFPVLIGLIVLAKTLTITILKDQWLPMLPMLQILCIDWMSDHLCQINLNILFVKGRSDLAFKLECVKKTLAIIIFFISLYWGIIGVCWGRVLYGIIAVYLNSYYTYKLIGMSQIQQLKDIALPLLFALLMGGIIVLFNFSIDLDGWYSILMSLLVGSVSYFLMLHVFTPQLYAEMKGLILGLIKK